MKPTVIYTVKIMAIIQLTNKLQIILKILILNKKKYYSINLATLSWRSRTTLSRQIKLTNTFIIQLRNVKT